MSATRAPAHIHDTHVKWSGAHGYMHRANHSHAHAHKLGIKQVPPPQKKEKNWQSSSCVPREKATINQQFWRCDRRFFTPRRIKVKHVNILADKMLL